MNKHVSGSKLTERLLARPEGATMDEIITATGGPHYNDIRRLEARGYTIRKVKEGRATRYFATPPPDEDTFEVTVDAEGQVVLPAKLRERLRLTSGKKVTFTVKSDDRVIMEPVRVSITRSFGMLGKPPRNAGATWEEVDEIAQKALAERFRRSGR